MQGIFRLILLAICLESSNSRPRVKTMGVVMVGVWPQLTPNEAGGRRALTLPNLKEEQPTNPSHTQSSMHPCPTILRCPRLMNYPLESRSPTDAPLPHPTPDRQTNNKQKIPAHLQSSWWRTSSTNQDNSHHNITEHRHSPIPKLKSQAHPLSTPKYLRIQRSIKRRSSRMKRSVSHDSVQYVTNSSSKFRIMGDFSLYLTLIPSQDSLRLRSQHINNSCFRIHEFESTAPSTEAGILVMLQAHSGAYVQANSSGILSLVSSEVGVRAVTQLDNRFFRIASYIGDNVRRFKHVLTGLHLQAIRNGTFLVNTDPLDGEGMLFHEFNCSTT